MMKARELFQQGKKVSFCKNINELSSITAKEIAEHANKGNKDAMEVYQQCGKMLGQGLAVLIDLLNPERIILGSVYVRSKELLLVQCGKYYKENVYRSRWNVARSFLPDWAKNWEMLQRSRLQHMEWIERKNRG